MYLTTATATQQTNAESQDRSDSILLATWILLGVTVSVFFARQVLKAVVLQKVTVDDLLIFLATVFSIALSVTTSLLAYKGLSYPGLLAIERASVLMKGNYASDFLYIASLYFSKISLLPFFYTVLPVQRMHQKAIAGFATFVSFWSIASIVAIAFQCQLPTPWESIARRCFDTRAFWMVYCIIDMSTEVAMVMLSVSLVMNKRLSNSFKMAVVACFSPRALVAAASLIRLIWLDSLTSHGHLNSRPNNGLWMPAILSQIHVCLSVCTACIPYMVFIRRLDDSPTTTEFRAKETHSPKPSPLWSRRQRKSKILKSWNSNAVASLRYERVPHRSPQIPTPSPLSPLTSPRFGLRPSTARSGSTNRHGLSINIPERSKSLPRSSDVASPHTASSFALSPSCTPLLSMHSLVSAQNQPTPPPKTHSPRPLTASSCYSSRSLSPPSSARPARLLSLFPQSTMSEARHLANSFHPDIALVGTSPTRRPLTDQDRHKPSITTQPSKLSPAYHASSSQSTTTSPTSKRRHYSIQELVSPMGAAINNYFSSAVPKAEPPPVALSPVATPGSALSQRNAHVLSPTNNMRTQKPLPRSPLPGTSPDLACRELAIPNQALVNNEITHSSGMPLVRDARSSPKVVVRQV
ncbi:hypothetical protein HBI56_056970 [Parastagonospora nodorum]|uniref:Rhodopsin domain-containing protein n=1 Tax=Phaeosphaeria nodorum (strain SN15 / ATCC MYA-4574 / FGSC 10173) TaxID=321614 RepID=A0A7U2ICA0_PHANO|nr:hypothetical protein HBH56_095130 [Parastagonospora nodorum]QRD07148.1 hypothetical protein JI435_123510 [Parastagonospora nodorum SN15]KAH3930408.1 hypothetical protein HBH54_109450 [Parastagonospora nodorum]KAH4002936.1 hypothetical protein HBI10_069950 [Parastagonospora nodorum]KAH4027947.1 hypothetical protein HBI13_048050 [Parastagonospora nodorum]